VNEVLEDLITFIELHGFRDDWKSLGLSDDDLIELQVQIMRRPKGAPVIKGTGGLRKVRLARGSKGKRSGVRVGYFFLQEHGLVLLVIAFAKNEKEDLSPADRKTVRTLIEKAKREFSRRPIH